MSKLLFKVPDRKGCIEYLRQEGILDYFNIGDNVHRDIFDPVVPTNTPIPPQPEDLYRLHYLIRHRKVFNVLEFGLGFSTIVIADALYKNEQDFINSTDAPKVRLFNPFKSYVVDASEHWISAFRDKYQSEFRHFSRIEIMHSGCTIGDWNGQICHFFNRMPDVIADFIYLDAPSLNDVEGDINGISFNNCPERTVMSGDLLKIEPTLIPGTFILVDGRTNNARFLKNNFKRTYRYEHDEDQDISVFELLEAPLGKINRNQISYSLGESYFERLNDKPCIE